MRLECHLAYFTSNVMRRCSLVSIFFLFYYYYFIFWRGGVFPVVLWVANDGGQISDRCWKVSVVPLCPHVILLISLLSCFPRLCPWVSFFRFVQPQGQVALGSSKLFFCSAVRDFILFWFSAYNTTGLKLYFALFTHIVERFATAPLWCPAPLSGATWLRHSWMASVLFIFLL